MTIEKALEILQDSQRDLLLPLRGEFLVALKLGIEALERVQDMRISPCTTADEILPGETRD